MRDTATRGRMAEEAMREIQSRPTAKPTDVPESTPKHLAICTDCNNPMDNCRCEDWIAEDDQPTPAASPVAPPESELDKEITRWQRAIYDLCRKESGDDTIDGGGCDSGDPLDFTLAEISEAFGIIKDKLASPVAGGSAEKMDQEVAVITNTVTPIDCCQGLAPAHECFIYCGGTKPNPQRLLEMKSEVAGGSARIAEIASRLAAEMRKVPVPTLAYDCAYLLRLVTGELAGLQGDEAAEKIATLTKLNGEQLLLNNKLLFEVIPALQSRVEAALEVLRRSPGRGPMQFYNAQQVDELLAEAIAKLGDSAEGWVKVTPETMPRTGAACLIVWSGQVQNALYRRAGIGFACAGGYEWRRADDDEADAIPDAEVEFWKPRPCPPAAEEERSSL